MKHLFLNKELSLLAKKKGFSEICLRYWKKDKEDLFAPQRIEHFSNVALGDFCPEDSYPAPLYQQIIDWFREKHNWSIEMGYRNSHKDYHSTIYPILPNTGVYRFKSTNYYEALDKAIEEAFKLI